MTVFKVAPELVQLAGCEAGGGNDDVPITELLNRDAKEVLSRQLIPVDATCNVRATVGKKQALACSLLACFYARHDTHGLVILVCSVYESKVRFLTRSA